MAGHTICSFLVLVGCLFVIGQSRTVSRVDKSSIGQPAYPYPDQKLPFFLEEIYFHFFAFADFNGTWVSDNEIIVQDWEEIDMIKYNVVTGKKTTIFNGTILPYEYKSGSASLSANGEYILFSYNVERVFRHSKFMNLVVYDVKRGTFQKVANEARVSLAIWSPVGSELVYVLNNDIYHTVFKDGKSVMRRLTHSGKPGTVFNGIPDWVYEEEVLASATAMWYSPDGRHLAFATYDDTHVKDMEYSYYGTPGSLSNQYPKQVKLKYPKVGTPNPIVSLSMIDLTDSSSKLVTLKAPTNVVSSDNVLFTVSWWDSTHVAATWTNRVQNRSQLVMYDTRGTGKPVWYDEEKEGWLEPNNPINVGNYALLLRREDTGTKAGKFQHVVRYNYDGSRFTSRVDLTPGPSEVHSIVTVAGSKVYYLATAPGKPTERNLYSVPLDASQKPTCISCKHLTPEGNKCTYADATFSTRKSHYALTCTGPDPLTVTIYDANHRRITIWEDNESARYSLSERLMPLQRDFNVTVNGYDSRVRLLLPPNFDEKKVYPMLVHVYAGPGTARITDSLRIGYEHYMTTSKGVIYAMIDGRGSAYKGSKMLFEIYRHIGTVEVQDTIAVTKILQQRYKWIDPDRTGIWGWSYGGFTTGMVMAQDTGSVFKCGISVAPVTSWIYYDSIYTERYMGMPTEDDNLAGYGATDISQQVWQIRGSTKKYMLIHGTADDNVHYQQAMALAKTLEGMDIMFEQVTYTDESHALLRVSPHLYHTMEGFWNKCFSLDSTR